MIFQQDNSPVHVKINRETNVQFAEQLFKELDVYFINDWPARSPDTNVIENV